MQKWACDNFGSGCWMPFVSSFYHFFIFYFSKFREAFCNFDLTSCSLLPSTQTPALPFLEAPKCPTRWSLKHGLLALPQCEQCALQYKWWVTHNHRKTCRFIIVFLWWVGPVRLSYILRIYYNTMRQRGCMYVPSCTALSSTRQLPAFEMLRKVYNTSVGLIMWSRFLTLFGLKVTN